MRYSYSELSVPAQTYEGVKKIAQTARNHLCDLNQRFPGFATFGAVPGSPVDTWTRQFWVDMCSDTPYPPPPYDPPFNGGQCRCVGYYLKWELTVNVGTPNEGVVSEVDEVWGEISFTPPEPSSGGGGFNPGYLCYGFVTDPCRTSPIRVNVGGNLPLQDAQTLKLTVLGRIDGEPDGCGDLPPSYPLPTYLPPPSGDVNKPYPNPDPNNPRQRDWDFTIPLVWFDPDFTINVDVGGLTFQFDIGGVNINLGDRSGDGSPGSFDGNPPQFPSDYAKQPDLLDLRGVANETKDIAFDSNELLKDAASNDPNDVRNNPDKQVRTPRSSDDDKAENDIDNLLFVDVFLTSIPVNARRQSGDDADDVVYAGWFEFTSTLGFNYPRQPIHFQQSRFEAPLGASGYAYTLYQGFSGFAVVVTAL